MKTRIMILAAAAGGLILGGCAERQDATLPYGGNAVVYLGRSPARGSANDVAAVGDLAYVADAPYGISIYDISNPENPYLVDSLVLFEANPEVKLIEVDGDGQIAAVQATNSLLFYNLALGNFLFPLGSANHYEVQLQFAQDTLAVYRSDTDQGDGFNSELYLNTGSGDTLTFGAALSYSHYGNSAYGFALAGDSRAYVCYDLQGFALLDFSVPAAPVVIAQMNVPGRVRDADLTGDVLCLAAGYEGLITVDVSDPANPVQIGSLIIPNATDIDHVQTVGDRAYLLDAYDGVFVVDISNPSSPLVIGSLLTSNPSNFCLAGDMILVADEDMGLVMGQILY